MINQNHVREQAQINPDMITLAREYRGYTQKELAEKSGLKQPQIAMIEGGVENTVSASNMLAVAKALEFPEPFFYLDETRLSFGSSSVYYRKRATSITADDRRVISSRTNLHRICLRWMMDAVDIEPTLLLPQYDLDEISPSQAASTLRAAWQIPDGPVRNLTQLVERAGVVIIECDFGIKGIDGTSMRLTGLPPIIFLNSSLPPDRYRFTLAHELGHLVMHDAPSETMENEADEFASELLMQAIIFKAYISHLGEKPSLAKLVELKPYWKVAISAMVMRMHQLGQISAEGKKRLFILMSNYKMRTNEPQPFQKEVPSLHKKIFDASLADLNLSTEQKANMMKIPTDAFREQYGTFYVDAPRHQTVLRLVSNG